MSKENEFAASKAVTQTIKKGVRFNCLLLHLHIYYFSSLLFTKNKFNLKFTLRLITLDLIN